MKNYQPVILLKDTQIPENLGFTARSMLNCGLEKLRVINPKFSLNDEKIIPLSAGASKVIKNIKLYDSVAKSIADINFLVACTARKRTLTKIVQNPKESIDEIFRKINENNKVGILFGAEQSGLTNDDLSLCNRILTIETNPKFKSINLSHSVIIVCYEWLRKIKIKKIKKKHILASKDELNFFYDSLENLIKLSGFIKTKERRENILLKIKNIFSRIDLDKNEIDILFGIMKSLFNANNSK
ncbi:MAG: hypothetical protein CMM96_03255 [Rickettsiales bacterium]|nr:hypothetical protein [Rickettsiales bacterium]